MKARCIWYTGLPCSGKTTNAGMLAKRLREEYHLPVVHLDGDYIRDTMISEGLGFTKPDREVHLLRMGAIASLLCRQGIWVVCSFISPYEDIREEVRIMVIQECGNGTFMQVFIACPPDACADRDTKGMWAKAKRGEIKGFTGYDAPYEVPDKDESEINLSGLYNLDYNVQKVLDYLNLEGE